MLIRLVFGLLFLCCLSPWAQAQELFYESYNTKNGLPTNVIYDLLPSNTGHLYLGTDKGLYRFDGRNFKAMPIEASIQKSLTLTHLEEDHRGWIWSHNFANQLFVLREDSLYPVLIELNSGEKLVDLHAADGQLYLLTNDRLLRTHYPDTGLSVLYDNQNPITDLEEIRSLGPGLLAVVGVPDLLLFEQEQLQLRQHCQASINNQTKGWCAKPRMQVKGEELLLLNTYDGYYWRFNWKKQQEIGQGQWRSDKPVLYFGHRSTHQGKMDWWCTNKGLYLVENHQIVETFFEAEAISDVVQDREGNCWISTLYHGLIKVWDWRWRWRKHGEGEHIVVLEEVNGQVLAGQRMGDLLQLDSLAQVKARFSSKLEKDIEYIVGDGEFIRTSVGTFQFGRQEPVHSFLNGKTACMDRYGNWLIGAYNGAFAYAPGDSLLKGYGKIKEVGHFRIEQSPTFSDQRSKCILCDTLRNWVWLATIEGVFFGDLRQGLNLLQHAHNKALYVNKIIPWGDSMLLGSMKSGIWLWDQQQGLRPMTKLNQGLTDPSIRKMRRYGNTLAILNQKGLQFYDLAQEHFEQRLQSALFYGLDVHDFILHKGNWFLATEKGLIVVEDQDGVQPFAPPLLRFWGIRAGQKTLKIDKNSPFSLPANAANVHVIFDFVHFNHQDSRLQYSLDPQGQEWQNLVLDQEEIYLPSLSPGDYTLRLRCVDLSESQVLAQDTLFFSVAYPYWQKSWFLLILFSGILALALLLSRWNHRRTQAQQAIKTELLSSKLKALRAQMNPHFLYNVLNSIQGYIYGNQKSKASEHLGLFSMMMRKVLHLSEQEFVPLSEELSMLQLYLPLEAARFNDDFTYAFELDPQLSELDPLIPSLLLQPFVENAIKHGLLHADYPKHLRIAAQWLAASQELKIEIEDNGIGRAAAQAIYAKRRKQHQSFALNALSQRIDLLNNYPNTNIHLQVIDKMPPHDPHTGTLIVLKFKIHES